MAQHSTAKAMTNALVQTCYACLKRSQWPWSDSRPARPTAAAAARSKTDGVNRAELAAAQLDFVAIFPRTDSQRFSQWYRGAAVAVAACGSFELVERAPLLSAVA